MSAPQSKLDKFLIAMQRIYKFPLPPQSPTSPPPSQSPTWTPPPLSSGHRGRYLWTDAFGVLNFISLYKETGLHHYLQLSHLLISTVHSTLAFTRSDPSTPLPGATSTHPLAGGLRIGKESASGPDSDGQYHHYLTLWMFALNRMSIATGQREFNDLAVELARAIHPRFVYYSGGGGGGGGEERRPRMVWKMSVDLQEVLVSSEGNLDPVNGYVVFRLLRQRDGEVSGMGKGQGQGSEVLKGEIEDYRMMVERKWRGYASDDPLDLGMTLWTAHWFDGVEEEEEEWARGLVGRAKRDLLRLCDEEGYFDMPTRGRLAFREFGTCLGIRTAVAGDEWDQRAEKIVQTWEEEKVVPQPPNEKRAGRNATDELLPITLVMYAAALIPGVFRKGYL